MVKQELNNEILIEQSNNCYRLWHPCGYIICQICMPNDGQYMADSRALAHIVKALSARYRLK